MPTAVQFSFLAFLSSISYFISFPVSNSFITLVVLSATSINRLSFE